MALVLRILIGLGVLPAMGAPAFAAVFTNGSFELPGLAPDNEIPLSAGSGVLTGWTIGGNGGPLVLINSRTTFFAKDGAQALFFNGGDGATGTWISQTFDTVAGRSYRVSFYVGRYGSGPGGISLTGTARSAAGVLLGQVVATPPASGYGGVEELNFTATSATTTLQFTDTSNVTAAVDLLLDFVRVVEIGAVAPTITTQPQGQSAAVGATVVLSVAVTGTPPINYQWEKNGVAIGGATNATLAFGDLQAVNTGSYAVVVSNNGGTVTSNVVLITIGGAIAPTITAQPVNQSAVAGAPATFVVGVSGTSPFSYQWRFNGAPISGATGSSLTLPSVTAANVGSYTVLVTNAGGSATSSAVTLTVNQLPSITLQPVDQSVAMGSNVVFTAAAAGAGTLTFQWNKDGRAIAGANSSTLALPNVTNNDAGSYSVTVTNSSGSVESRVVTLVVSAPTSRLTNLSVRTAAGAGNQMLIVGFVVTGPGGKPVMVRGIGPSLAAFGVGGAVADPQVALYRGDILIATNDNWGDSTLVEQIADTSRRVGAFAIETRSLDSALLSTLQPESYTVQLAARGGGGIALIELYDGNSELPARIVNVSARCLVGTGGDILIAGFYVSGNAPKTLLLRAVGPTLGAFGVTGVLADPQLVVQGGTEIRATNEDWWLNNGATTLPPVFASVGAFPLAANSRDAALVVTLPPGSYSARITGTGNTTGVALVEIYEVP